MFHLDRTRILDADVFLFVLDGRVPDEERGGGAGIAYCQNLQNGEKLLVGLHTDTRAAFIGEMNPVRVPLDYIVDDEESHCACSPNKRLASKRHNDDQVVFNVAHYRHRKEVVR